jgi:hypothetical protein
VQYLFSDVSQVALLSHIPYSLQSVILTTCSAKLREAYARQSIVLLGDVEARSAVERMLPKA